MPILKYAPLLLYGSAVIIAILSISVLGTIPLSVPLVGTIFIMLTRGIREGFWWGLISGAVLEIASPFPTLAFLGALCTTSALVALMMHHYLSHRGLLAVAAGGAVGGLVFEGLLFLYAMVLHPLAPGFVPVFDQAYLAFVGKRMLSALVSLVLLFWLFQQASPRARGLQLAR